MMTMNRRSDKLDRSTHQEGGLHHLSRQRADDHASAQADSPQPRLLSGPGPGAGRQCRYRREVAPAPRSHGSLQPTAPSAQRLAPRSGLVVELVAEGLVAGSGHGVAGLAPDRVPATQSLGGVSGTGPVATPSAPQPTAPPEPPPWAVPGLSPWLRTYRYLCAAASGRPASISVRCHQSGYPADDDADRLGTRYGQCRGLPGPLSAVLSLPPLSGADRQQAGVHVVRVARPEWGPHHQGPSIHPALSAWPDPAQPHQGVSSLDQRLGRAHRRHHQSRTGLSVAFRVDRHVRRGPLWVRTIFQRASPLQSDGRQHTRTVDARMVSPITHTISPAASRIVHNLVTLDS